VSAGLRPDDLPDALEACGKRHRTPKSHPLDFMAGSAATPPEYWNTLGRIDTTPPELACCTSLTPQSARTLFQTRGRAFLRSLNGADTAPTH